MPGWMQQAMNRDELRRIGVYTGSGGCAQDWTEEQYRFYYEGRQKQCSVYVIPTSTPGTLASEVSMRFGFRGLSHIVSTGCTSSTDAIGYAAREVERGGLEYAIAGGTDSPIAPLIIRGFQLMRIMTSRWNRRAGAWFAPVLAGSRRVRFGGRRMVFRARRTGACARARREDLR